MVKPSFRLWAAVGILAVGLLIFYQVIVKKAFDSWGKTKIETILSQQFNRPIEMGEIHWGLSLYGGALDTDKLLVKDTDGTPFLSAMHTRITVAVLPLLSGKFLPRHVDIDAPDLRLVRLGVGKWNYSDMPKLPPLNDLTHFEMKNATIHLIDRSRTKEATDKYQTELDAVNCKVERPLLDRDWPFKITAEIVHPSYTTKVTMSGRGKGKIDDWQVNSQAFELKAEKLNLHDFDRFFGAVPDVGGNLDIELSGSGVPLKGFQGKGKVKTSNYAVAVDNIDFEGSLTRVIAEKKAAGGATVAGANQNSVKPAAATKNSETKEKGSSDNSGSTADDASNTIAALLKEMKASLNFRNADLAVENTSVAVKRVNGKVRFDNGKILVDELGGMFEESQFKVSGSIAYDGLADLKYHGTSIDIETVKRAVKELKLKAPPVVNEPYFGHVKEADATLKGRLDSPELTLTAVPQDLFYEKQGTRYFMVTGGRLDYDGKRCQFRDLEGPVKAMVLAAGVGSRLDPLTRTTPKPLVPIANRPVMEHILRLLKHHNIVDVISNLHHLPEKIPAYFGDGQKAGVKATFRQEEHLSGDAGGVRFCRDFLDGSTFIVIMGDLITDADLTYVIEQHRAKGAIASIALQRVADVSHFGVAVLDDECFIKGFQEKPKPEEAISDLASTGIYVLEPEVFNHIPPTGDYGFGRQLFPTLVNLGLPVLGVQVFGYWSDIGTIDMYRRSSFDALNGLIDLDMPGEQCEQGWIGEGAKVASDCSIDGIVLIGKNTVIEPGVELKGHVIIGDNCRIAAGAKVSESIIWSGTRIGEQTTVIDSVIGDNCDIGAGAELSGKVTVDSVPAVRHKVIRHSNEACSALSH